MTDDKTGAPQDGTPNDDKTGKPADGAPQDGTPGTPSGGTPPQDGGNDDGGDNVPKWIRDELKRAREEAAAERVKRRKLEEAAEAAEAKRLAESGEYKTLYETAATKIGERDSRIAELERELETLRAYKQSHDERAEAERLDAIGKLPEDIRDAFANASIEQITAMLRKLDAPGTSPGGGDRRPPRTSGGAPGNKDENGKPTVPFASTPGMSDVFQMLTKNKG